MSCNSNQTEKLFPHLKDLEPDETNTDKNSKRYSQKPQGNDLHLIEKDSKNGKKQYHD